MSQQEHIERREEQDVDQWLRSRSLSELRRLAEFCGVPIKRGDHERDIIDHLRTEPEDAGLVERNQLIALLGMLIPLHQTPHYQQHLTEILQ